jgi:hypothetical protein
MHSKKKVFIELFQYLKKLLFFIKSERKCSHITCECMRSENMDSVVKIFKLTFNLHYLIKFNKIITP